MSLPDWRTFGLLEAVQREPNPDPRQLVLWVPAGDGAWERIATVPGAAVSTDQGISAVAATAVRARRQRPAGFLASLFGRPREPAGRTWVLPDASSAEQIGERRTDLVLAWSDDRQAPDAIRVAARWPGAAPAQTLGSNLILVSGVVPPAPPEPVVPRPAPVVQADAALHAARAAGNRRAEAQALTDLGVALTREGRAAEAASVLEEAIVLARELGDATRERDALGNLGWTAAVLGDAPRSLQLLEQTLALARDAGDRVEEKVTLFRLGNAWAALGDPARASAYFEAALALARALGDWQHEVELLWSLATQAAEAGRRDEAVAHGQAAVELLEHHGHAHAPWYAENLRAFREGGPDAGLERARDLLGAAITPAEAPPAPAGGVGVLRMALSATKAVTRYIGSGLKTVPAERHRRRLEICTPCEHHTGVRCRVCGCFTAVKAWLPHETCPIGKWPV